MSDSQYVKSTAENKHWNLYTYKPQGRPGYAFACEGELENVDSKFQSFTFEMFSNRTVKEDIPGRMTVKARNAALQSLFTKMQEAGLIAEGETLKPVV
ncbi:hypothetical protein Xoosp13_29 [Xanthomonas phage Xoo-sp13]|nr:hypothetical protein Xoosp13_29 [Xanthomonas phage Xoo-sp13]